MLRFAETLPVSELLVSRHRVFALVGLDDPSKHSRILDELATTLVMKWQKEANINEITAEARMQRNFILVIS